MSCPGLSLTNLIFTFLPNLNFFLAILINFFAMSKLLLFILDPKYLDINENLIYSIDNYEDFLTNSLKKFVEYDRPA